MSRETQNDDETSESEWEYEYDDTETQDFYITIDLPLKSRLRRKYGNIDDELGDPEDAAAELQLKQEAKAIREKRKRTESRGKVFRRKRRRRNPDTGILEERSPEPDEESGPEVEPEPAEQDDDDDRDRDRGDADEEMGDEEKGENDADDGKYDEYEFQVLNLHTKQPVVAYKGRVYTCEWATAMGTDMIFAKHNEDNYENQLEEGDSNALRSLRDWDLIACSGTRLKASEAKLKYNLPILMTEQGGRVRRMGPSFTQRLRQIQVAKGELDESALDEIDADEPASYEVPTFQHLQDTRPIMQILDMEKGETRVRRKRGTHKRRAPRPIVKTNGGIGQYWGSTWIDDTGYGPSQAIPWSAGTFGFLNLGQGDDQSEGEDDNEEESDEKDDQESEEGDGNEENALEDDDDSIGDDEGFDTEVEEVVTIEDSEDDDDSGDGEDEDE